MNRRGFSVVELLIIIVVMGILLTLAVVNLRDSQKNGRDAERKADVESIALHLETFYTSGTDGSTEIGRYPSTVLIGQETVLLRDIDTRSLISPTSTSSSLVAATTSSTTQTPTVEQYIYQPLQNDGSLCTTEAQECRSFNLYYLLETESGTQVIESNNQ